MPRELKVQLLMWSRRHRLNCKLVMISNRLDQEDLELFDQCLGHGGPQTTGTVTAGSELTVSRGIRIVQARGSCMKILRTMVFPDIRSHKPVRYHVCVVAAVPLFRIMVSLVLLLCVLGVVPTTCVAKLTHLLMLFMGMWLLAHCLLRAVFVGHRT